MEISVNEQGCIEFKKVYNSICFKTETGQVLAVCMRDDGYEIGISRPSGVLVWHTASNGIIKELGE